MAVELGVTAGFVTTEPTSDPNGSGFINDNRIACGKFTVAEDGTISKIGWYCGPPTEEANFQACIYSHDAVNDRPGSLLASSGDVAKGTTEGWKWGNVSYEFVAGTYWLGPQIDDTATSTTLDYTTDATAKLDYKSASTPPATWGTSSGTYGRLAAVVAVYTPAAGGASLVPKIMQSLDQFGGGVCAR